MINSVLNRSIFISLRMPLFKLSVSSLSMDDNSIDHITSLERTVCSNYVCCGDQHCDLHALLEHMEEEHLLARTPNGKRVYPRDGLRTVPLLHSAVRASSLSPSSTPGSSPVSSTPSSPSDLVSPISPISRPQRKSSLSSMHVKPVYTPFTPSLPVDPLEPYIDADEIMMSHGSLDYTMNDVGLYNDFPSEIFTPSCESKDLTLETPLIIPMTPSMSDQDTEMIDINDSTPDLSEEAPLSPLTALPRHIQVEIDTVVPQPLRTNIAPAGRCKKPLKSKKIAHSALSSGSSSSSIKAHTLKRKPSPGSGKVYFCPTEHCVKKYRNANGLKYHIEKGACKLEVEPTDNSEENTVEEDSSTSDDPASHSPFSGSSSEAPPIDILTEEANPDITKRIYALPTAASTAESPTVPSSGAKTMGNGNPTNGSSYYHYHNTSVSSQSPPVLDSSLVAPVPVAVPIVSSFYLPHHTPPTSAPVSSVAPKI